MKNKNTKSAKKGQQKTLKAPMQTLNLKNRNKLRKKLKVLLENETVTLTKNASPTSTTKVVPEPSSKLVSQKKPIQTTNSINKSKQLKQKPDPNVNGKKAKGFGVLLKKKKKVVAKSPKFPNEKNNGIPSGTAKSDSEIVKKGNKKKTKGNLLQKLSTEKVNKHESNSLNASSQNIKTLKLKETSQKENGISLKRKLKANNQSGKKAKKLEENLQSNEIEAPKKIKKHKLTPKIDHKKDEPATSQFQSNKKNNKKGELKEEVKIEKNKKETGQPKVETKLTKSQEASKKSKITKDKKSKTEPKKSNLVQEPDFEHSLSASIPDSPGSSEKSPNKNNTEQSLIRATDKSPSPSSDDDTFSYESESQSNSGYSSYDSDDDLTYSEDDFTEEDYISEEDDYYGEQEDGFCLNDLSSDETYEPPGNINEDVYIASGTAITHDLSATSDLCFDSDTSSAQIIELPSHQSNVQVQNAKPVKKTKTTTKLTADEIKENSYINSDDSCPELVPIADSFDNATYNLSDGSRDFSDSFSESEDNFSSHSSDEESSNCGCSSSSCQRERHNFSSEEECTQMKPEIITAVTPQCVNGILHILSNKNDLPRKITTATSLIEELSEHAEKTSSYKVYTINNEVLSTESLANAHSENELATTKPVQLPHSPETKEVEETSCANSSLQSSNAMEVTDNKNEINSKRSVIETSEKQSGTPNTPVKNLQSTPKKSSQHKSRVRTLFYNAINSNHVLVLLKEPLYLYGTVKLKLLAGSLEVFGYNPKRNERVEIFSPRGYSSLKIEPSSSSLDEVANEKEILSLSPYFIRSDLEEILVKYETNKDAIVILERNDRSKKVNMLKKYMVEHLFPNMNSMQSDRPFYTSEFLLRCIITTNSDNAVVIDPKWRAITMNKNSRIMAIGGKAVGKSTLLRYLVNRNLNKYPKILLIDLDIGQPEMFVPQAVSATSLTEPLLGPGYFLNKQPDKAFLVGNVNIVLTPERYIKSVQALLEYCNSNEELKDIPWIINTMGYNKGFGDELIAVICNILHPTNIVQLESNREINNFDFIMSKDNVESLERNIIGDMFTSNDEFKPQHQLSLMKSVIPANRTYQMDWSMKPRDMRLAIIICRLSSILRGHAEWLTDVKPVCASTDDLNVINLGDEQINKEDMLKTLVGNLVYLCHQESEKAIECLGIGIVRGIDYPLKQIYLLPAFSVDLLQNVNCLAVCGIPLPSSILINQGPKVKGIATYVYNTVNEKSSMHIKQMYNRPQRFLTGRRKSVFE